MSATLEAVRQQIALSAAREIREAYIEGAQLARTEQRFTPAQQAIEELAENALARAPQPIPAQAIRRQIEEAQSPEDLAERLAALYDGNDATPFRELLERALFAADIMGYAHTETQD